VHESLVQNWPMLRRWLDENQDDAELIDQLRNAARQWQAKNRDVGLLWRGDTAEEAKKFKKRYKGTLSDVERAFLEEVVNYELAQQRKRRSMVIAGFIALGAVVLAAMVALVIIQKSRSEAKSNANKAEIAKVEAEKAKTEAEQNLAEVQRKEQERLTAENAKKTAETKLGVTSVALDKSQEDLQKTNDELKHALDDSLANEEKAKAAAKLAEESAAKAKAAATEAENQRAIAQAQRDKADQLTKQATERADRLQTQLGSKSIEDLK